MMKKIIFYITGTVVLLAGVYLAGPRFPKPELNRELPEIRVATDEIEEYVKRKESVFPVKPDNEARIVWADSIGKRTEYVLLYLHGFSASRYEGYPVTHEFVKEFKMNAYLPRLAAHGLADEEPLLYMTPDSLYQSAKEALVLAHQLGDKVVVMGTSTGGTLALMLAGDFPELVDGLILYSPNIRIKEKASVLLSGPWGLQIGRLAFGGKYRITDDDPNGSECRYWNCKYRVEATVYLQQLLDARMNPEEFAKVKQPIFLGYYYKDEDHQDQTVEVKAMFPMFDELGTPAGQKVKVAFPEAGRHVIACELTSKAVSEVREETFKFVREHIVR